MKKQLDAVKRFHESFEVPFGESPQLILKDRGILRYTLMSEENDEYLEAMLNGDKVEIADALGDMLYILCGTILEHGMQDKIEEVFNEIQRSNMSKLGKDGKPIFREDGKILKGEDYFPPNISEII